MTTPNQTTALTLANCASSDTWKIEIQKVLPKELVIEAFLRVTRTVASEAKFAQCDQRSFLSALLKCARAGLVPDGVHAHLIPFGKEVSCIFDWKGVVDVAARHGIEIIPKRVCANDKFSVQEDDGNGRTVVTHSWGMGERGEVIGFYSRSRKDGSIDYEFMTIEEVEQVRQNYSRAKDSKAWEKSFDEMAKKTVIKRHAKRLPLSQEARAALIDEDEPMDVIKSPVIDAPPIEKVRRSRATHTLVETTVEPEPEKKPEETKQPEPEQKPSEPVTKPAPIEEAEGELTPEEFIMRMAKANNITTEQLITFMRKEKWMTNPEQTKVSELSERKLISLGKAWKDFPVETLKKIHKANGVEK